MVTKAIIEEIISDYEVKVRVPIYDSMPGFKDATNTIDLYSATICIPPKSQFLPSIGDIVFITFEDNDLGKPIIIGCLFKETSNLSNINMTLDLLTTTSTTKLSSDTYIGDIKPIDIKALKGIEGNIQDQLNLLSSRLDKLENV